MRDSLLQCSYVSFGSETSQTALAAGREEYHTRQGKVTLIGGTGKYAGHQRRLDFCQPCRRVQATVRRYLYANSHRSRWVLQATAVRFFGERSLRARAQIAD